MAAWGMLTNFITAQSICQQVACKLESIDSHDEIKGEASKSTPVGKKKSGSIAKKPASPIKLPEAQFKVRCTPGHWYCSYSLQEFK